MPRTIAYDVPSVNRLSTPKKDFEALAVAEFKANNRETRKCSRERTDRLAQPRGRALQAYVWTADAAPSSRPRPASAQKTGEVRERDRFSRLHNGERTRRGKATTRLGQRELDRIARRKSAAVPPEHVPFGLRRYTVGGYAVERSGEQSYCSESSEDEDGEENAVDKESSEGSGDSSSEGSLGGGGGRGEEEDSQPMAVALPDVDHIPEERWKPGVTSTGVKAIACAKKQLVSTRKARGDEGLLTFRKASVTRLEGKHARPEIGLLVRLLVECSKYSDVHLFGRMYVVNHIAQSASQWVVADEIWLQECAYCSAKKRVEHIVDHELRCTKRPPEDAVCGGCGMTVRGDLVGKHSDICSRRLERCHMCLERIAANEMDTHKQDTCPSRRLQCSACQLWIEARHMTPHFAECPLVRLTCLLCRGQYHRGAFEMHTSAECPSADKHCRACGKLVPGHEYALHARECAHRITSCRHCPYKGSARDLATHKESCSKRPRQCVMCQSNVPADAYDVHVKKECLQRASACAECGAKVETGKRVVHTSSKCLERRVQCKFCWVTILAKHMKKHLPVCPNVPLPCKYCKMQLDREDLPQHVLICDERRKPCENCGAHIKHAASREHALACKARPSLCSLCGLFAPLNALKNGIHARSECPATPLPCRFGCSVGHLRRDSLSEHEAATCPSRPVKCGACRRVLRAKDLSAHQGGCSKYQLRTCEACGESMAASTMQRHVATACSARMEDCPVCARPQRVTDLPAHLAGHSKRSS